MQTERDADPDVDQQRGVQLSQLILPPVHTHRIPSRGHQLPGIPLNISIKIKGQPYPKGARQVSKVWYLYCFIKERGEKTAVSYAGL